VVSTLSTRNDREAEQPGKGLIAAAVEMDILNSASEMEFQLAEQRRKKPSEQNSQISIYPTKRKF
jgi:hypothetical protein